MIFRCNLSLLVIFNFFIIVRSDAVYQTTAAFYESSDKKGSRLSFKDGLLGWSNIPEALTGKTKSMEANSLCVTGAWLLYGNVGFRTTMEDHVNILSGSGSCIDIPKNLTIKSAQPVTPAVYSDKGSITLFTNKNFGSPALIVSEEESRERGVKQLKTEYASIGSTIVIGKNPWSLIGTKGQVICIRPQPSEAILNSERPPLCYATNLLRVHIDGFEVNAVYPDCPAEHDNSVVANIRLPDCREFGSGSLQFLKNFDQMGRSLDNALECHAPAVKAQGTKFTDEEFELISKLINIRLTHDFNSDLQTMWPDATENMWKTIPMDTVFDIALTTVPGNVVSLAYLRIVREFTAFHLNEIWKAKEATPRNLKEWKTHRTINHLLTQCFELAGDKQSRYHDLITSSYNQQRTLQEFTGLIFPEFTQDKNRDPIIEMAWVVSNYALALCHELFQYQINFWDNFITTFENLYFAPLAKRWTTPSPLTPQAFGAILSGFGTASQHKRMSFAASTLFGLTPRLKPFEKAFVQGTVPEPSPEPPTPTE